MKAERTAELPTVHPRSSDTTRAHALNWFVSVTSIVLCGLVAVYILAKSLLDVNLPGDVVWLILLAPLIGTITGAIKLIQFTSQHRQWLYDLESTLDMDLNRDGEIGKPEAGETATGSFLMCPDGTRRRVDTELSADDVKAVKRVLLGSGKATVRALTGVVGDRASVLRQELIELGICSKPEHSRAAATLTESGRKAVRRW
jgi:hypothetical protein